MRYVRPGRFTVPITSTARGFDQSRSHGGQLMCYPPFVVFIVVHAHSIASRLFSIARDPGSDVLWAVAKLNTLLFTRSKEANSVTVHESKVSQLQDDGPRRRLQRE
jgi:hypothetical protein